jgi:hypothetical protein
MHSVGAAPVEQAQCHRESVRENVMVSRFSTIAFVTAVTVLSSTSVHAQGTPGEPRTVGLTLRARF